MADWGVEIPNRLVLLINAAATNRMGSISKLCHRLGVIYWLLGNDYSFCASGSASQILTVELPKKLLDKLSVTCVPGDL